jgi:TRAP-type C4-dicarboxylate transport system permease small subunit
VGICFVQVIVRYMFGSSFSWAEEVSVILMIWSTWAGVCLAVKRGTHLRILFVVERIGPARQKLLQLLFNTLAIIFLVYIIFTSRIILDGLTNMTLLSLPWVPMKTLYFSVPIGCVLLIYYLLGCMLSDLKSLIS